MALYITKLNLDGTQYSAINTINKLDLDGVVYDIGLNTSDANAVSSDIKQGKTAYANGQKIIGAIPPYGSVTITPVTHDQSFGPGVYLNDQITVLGSPSLIPENIKSGVSIFGVNGNVNSSDQLDVLASVYFTRHGYNATILYWNGSSYTTRDVQYGSATISGTVVKVVILSSSGGNICGHSGAGIYTSSHTNTINGLSDGNQSFAVLGIK